LFKNSDLLNELRPRLEENREMLTEWFEHKRTQYPVPLYGSVDVRDSGWKVAAVDVNAFPAGFNNIEEDDLQRLVGPMRHWLDNEYPGSHLVLLWPESNTRNPGYAENILVIKNLIQSAGRECRVGSVELADFAEIEALTGFIPLSPVTRCSDGVLVNGQRPDLIISNNDLTSGKIPSGTIPVAPPQGLGWFQRKKSNHFQVVQPFIDEVAELLEIDPWMLGTHWFVSENKCLEQESCRQSLAKDVDDCLEMLRDKYNSLGIDSEPKLFVKNNSGTYGLGILEISSGDELLKLSKRKMNKLTYGKGGSQAIDFLIQEGVPTRLKWENNVIEPCMYSVGGDVDAWFYRANSKKGNLTNLNTPSTRFIAPSKLKQDEGGQEALQHASGWHTLVAELALLGLSAEYAEFVN
jgi:glutamate--cysteine ligase